MNSKLLFRILHWLLMIIVILFILSGYGITEYRLIESITFGLLSKPLAFQIHFYLIYPFLLLLIIHILIPTKKKWKKILRKI